MVWLGIKELNIETESSSYAVFVGMRGGVWFCLFHRQTPDEVLVVRPCRPCWDAIS